MSGIQQEQTGKAMQIGNKRCKTRKRKNKKNDMVLILISILLCIVLSICAYKERGYYAIGGEYMVLLLPFLYYVAKDTYHTYR